jgi:hypothetical protein
VRPQSYLKGLVTFVPGVYPHLVNRFRSGRTGETTALSARYCYSVWLRHMTVAHAAGLDARPESVAELGPGDSLGIGLAALLSGVERYYGFDVVHHASHERNLRVLAELIELFTRRAPIPDQDEFPEVEPRLPSYAFPAQAWPEDRLRTALAPERLRALERLAGGSAPANGGPAVTYVVPWNDPSAIRPGSVDVVLSQAVMEHVDDLEGTYRALQLWLKPGGYMSHTIDFRCHGTAAQWNGHWACSDLGWKLVRGRLPYLLNRQPHSAHVRLAEAAGFELVTDLPTRLEDGLGRERLAPRFRDSLTGDDLTTALAFVQARKRR